MSKILKPSRRSFGGEFKKISPRTGDFFLLRIFFSFVLVSHSSCAFFSCFKLYLAPVLSVFVCVFLYWVRPLVMILTFAASVFRVGVHSIGCALRAPHQTLTSVPEKEVKKIFSYGVYCCAPFGRLTGPSHRSFGGSQRRSEGGRNAVNGHSNVFQKNLFFYCCFF